MDYSMLRCPNCGNRQFEDESITDKQIRCPNLGCGAVLLLRKAEAFARLEEERAALINEKHVALTRALREKNVPVSQVRALAQSLVAELPDDCMALFALRFCDMRDGDAMPLRAFLLDPGEITTTEAAAIIEITAPYARVEDLKPLRALTEKCPEDAERLIVLIDKAHEKLRFEADAYADVPRDAFIFHHDASDAAAQVCEALENDSWICWMAERNLDQKSLNRDEDVDRAIRRSRIFISLTTESAMLSREAQRVLGVAEAAGCARLEIALDDAERTAKFRHFYTGIQPIDARGGLEDAICELRERVYRILRPAPAPVDDRSPESIINDNPAEIPVEIRVDIPEEITINRVAPPVKETPEKQFRFRVARGSATLIRYTGKSTVVSVPAHFGDAPVTAIGDRAFARREELIRVVLPNTLKEIGSEAFMGCLKLATVAIPDTVARIGAGAFMDCASLGYAPIPAALRMIEPYAYCRCRALKSMRLPPMVEEIGASAFEDCARLSRLDIPSGSRLKRVRQRAFRRCPLLAPRWPSSVKFDDYQIDT